MVTPVAALAVLMVQTLLARPATPLVLKPVFALTTALDVMLPEPSMSDVPPGPRQAAVAKLALLKSTPKLDGPSEATTMPVVASTVPDGAK